MTQMEIKNRIENFEEDSRLKIRNQTFTNEKEELTHRWKEDESRKIRSDLQLLLEGQKINQKDLRLGFIGLANQNSELLDSNN